MIGFKSHYLEVRICAETPETWAHLEAGDWLMQCALMQVPTAQVLVSLRDFHR